MDIGDEIIAHILRPIKQFACPICHARYSDMDFVRPAHIGDVIPCNDCGNYFELNTDGTTSFFDFEVESDTIPKPERVWQQ